MKWVIDIFNKKVIRNTDPDVDDILSSLSIKNLPEEEHFDRDHKKYEKVVWSMTQSNKVLERIGKVIEDYFMDKEEIIILNLGCGSVTNLQSYLIDDKRKFKDRIKKIICSDYSVTAIEKVKEFQGSLSNENSAKIEAIKIKNQELSTNIPENSVDLIINVNSILSGNDIENRRVIKECHKVLKPNGILCGFFPSVFAVYEISYLEEYYKFYREKIINIELNTFKEEKQDLSQIFYTPLRLNQIFKESLFNREIFEMFFCDDDEIERESEKIYGFPPKSGLNIWEMFVIERK